MANVLDRVIGYVSPKARLRREYYRSALSKYEGASKEKRMSGWKTRSTSANTEIRGALHTLRDRSRDLIRNNPYATAAAREIPAHTVGEGIIPQARGRTRAQTQRIERIAKQWFDTPACDANGRTNFYGLENEAMRAVVESGEVFIRRRRRRAEDGLPVPMQLQILEADHLDTRRDFWVTEQGNRVLQGIEFDRIGKRVAYYMYREHPGEVYRGLRSLESVRVPAEDILHIYRADRPGQIRGVPWGAPVIVRLKGFDEYEDAQLQRQKVAACFSAFVRDVDPVSQASQETTELPEKLEPGLFEFLPGGKDITFAQPPGVDGYDEYSTVTLHGVSTGFGVPYFVLTGDLRSVNYSAGRMGWLSFQRDISQWRWHMLIPQMCNPVWDWFMDAMRVSGQSREYVPATWTPPRREMVDPSREVPAIRDAIRSGQMTQYEGIRQMGYDPEDFLDEVAEGNAKMDELGIVLDSDPRKVSNSGVVQASPPYTEQDDQE